MTWKTLPTSYAGCIPDDHLTVLGGYERQAGDTVHRIERVKVSPTSAYERPSYRLLRIDAGEITGVRVFDTLREARRART